LGCARDLYREGVNLALTYFNSPLEISTITEGLDVREGVKISIHRVNVGSKESLEQLLYEIKEQHGQDAPDILVSNAGTPSIHNSPVPFIEDISVEDFEHVINVNLRATFILSKSCIPFMVKQQWGRLIYVSSISALGSGINGCHYAASKAAMTGMMKNLATRYAKDGITANDVAPGAIGGTGMIPNEEYLAGTPGDVKNIPVG
jgi:3-oxoacyl-[acyl-carrier protein] reductase